MPLPIYPFPHVPTRGDVVGFRVTTDTGLIVAVVVDEVGLRVTEGFNVGFTDDSLDGMGVLGFGDVGFIAGLDDDKVGDGGVVFRHGPF